MDTPKSPTIKKVFDAFEAKSKVDERIDDGAVSRLMALLNGGQTITPQRVREALFPVVEEDGNEE